MENSFAVLCFAPSEQLQIADHFEVEHELSGSQSRTSECEAHLGKLAGGVNPVGGALIRQDAIGKYTVDELGVIHMDLDLGECFTLDCLHRRGLLPYTFTGSFPATIKGVYHL